MNNYLNMNESETLKILFHALMQPRYYDSKQELAKKKKILKFVNNLDEESSIEFAEKFRKRNGYTPEQALTKIIHKQQIRDLYLRRN